MLASILRQCRVAGCPRQHDSHGYCALHCMRWKRHGDPLWQPPTPSQLFWAKVVEADDCWLWTGSGNRYGKFTIRGQTHLAHRFAYEDMVGDIPEGLTIDHLCQNKKCVNPEHLDPVPLLINVRRRDAVHGIGSAVTHCPKNHPYDETNTSRRNGRRYCKACARERARANYYRKKAG